MKDVIYFLYIVSEFAGVLSPIVLNKCALISDFISYLAFIHYFAAYFQIYFKDLNVP